MRKPKYPSKLFARGREEDGALARPVDAVKSHIPRLGVVCLVLHQNESRRLPHDRRRPQILLVLRLLHVLGGCVVLLQVDRDLAMSARDIPAPVTMDALPIDT